MTTPEPNFSVNVDVANPGQFFACCGLLELAHRLWPGAEGWFDIDRFHVLLPNRRNESLESLIAKLQDASLVSDDPKADGKIAPLRLGDGFDLRLDWWFDETGGSDLKTWAGPQSVLSIAPAMKAAIPQTANGFILNHGQIVREPNNQKKPVEPFYFDARRFAHPLDTGFSLDVQDAETVAYPAVELLSLIGLQRFRPAAVSKWTFEYTTWSVPLCPVVAAAVVCGALPGSRAHRFRLLFRDDRRRYKAFAFSTIKGGQS